MKKFKVYYSDRESNEKGTEIICEMNKGRASIRFMKRHRHKLKIEDVKILNADGSESDFEKISDEEMKEIEKRWEERLNGKVGVSKDWRALPKN